MHVRTCRITIGCVVTVLMALTSASRADETPPEESSPAPRESIALFNGKNLDGWTMNREPVTKGWTVEDGVLHCEGKVGAIWTEKEYGDFDLSFDWKIAKGGNSGIKYRMAFYQRGVRGKPGWLGPEYQMFDELTIKTTPQTSSASLYDLVAPSKNKKLKPVGEFNTGRIVSRGTKIEHWLNGEKLVDIDTSSDEWRERVAASKFALAKDFGKNRKGRIMITDHRHPAWFRNIRIREFDQDDEGQEVEVAVSEGDGASK